MKLKLILLAGLFAMGFAMTANAGNVADADGDGVPDTFDNCAANENGPDNTAPAEQCFAQENADGDAFGDRCDADYNNDGFVNSIDFTPFFNAFVAGVPLNPGEDANCDGAINSIDFTPFFNQFLKDSPGLP